MKRLIAKAVLVSLLSACSTSSKSDSAASSEAVTYVLVHGALATKSAWAKTEAALLERGQRSVSFNVPGRGQDGLKPKEVNLEVATKNLCEVVAEQSSEVVLVGHSQGGALISHAQSFCPTKVKALVYVTAVIPLKGETPFDMLDPKLDTGFGKITKFDPEAGLFVLNRKAPIAQLFMGDVPQEEAKLAVKEMVSEPIGIGTMKMDTDNKLIFSKPTFYVETTEDKIISLQTQRRIHSRIPGIKVFTMNASHAPFLSQADRLADILVQVNSP